ncbi:hypothetical protein SEA_OTTAWA_67 [Arthrobacter phage Ottawa]|nr:hypothetical protein SEA_KHARCHO_67 [Arthrobacter phage Kharcho]WIC89299.1 hypothetical protein SEA_OTTAWA_67 [Arthrobacter phage Ottawa]
MPKPWKIEWPDGSITDARSSYELLARLGKEQPMGPVGVQEMKDLLSRRAQAMPGTTGQYIHPYQPDRPFLIELGRVGLYKIIEEGDA